jgi:hypothetical protein
MRERDGRTLAQVFAGEEAAVPAIRQRIAHGTVVHADESPAWNPLHARFAMQRVNHQDGYSVDGACTNGAEAYFSRLRRGELGHHHHIAGPYLVRYAQEAASPEDLRRVSNGEQTHGIVGLAMRSSPSVDFCGYWQRAQAVEPTRHETTPAASTRWIVALARLSDPRTVFWTRAQLRSSVTAMALRPMTCSVSARVVMGCGASRSTSWISRKHSPG